MPSTPPENFRLLFEQGIRKLRKGSSYGTAHGTVLTAGECDALVLALQVMSKQLKESLGEDKKS